MYSSRSHPCLGVNEMNGQDLKNSILQLAIQGKLVEQRQEEGTAKELLEQIRSEKERMVKEGGIRKQKALPEITAEEIPFDIPESWEWVKLVDIVSTLGDGIHGTPNYDESGEYHFINGNNLKDGKVEIKDKTKRVSYEEYMKYKKELNDNTVLVSINGTIGNVAFYNNEKIILGKSACYFNLLSEELKFYLFLVIKTRYFLDYAVKNATGTTIKNVSLATMKNFMIPFPPLEEQKRIVSKIEELLPYFDQYDDAHAKVEELNNEFPEEMQKSILQYAIKGKLVEQRQDEGTAEELYQQIQAEKAKLVKEGKIKREKPLPAITEDEIPFDIPESWKWVRLGYVTNYGVGKQVNKTEIPSKSWILELEDIEKATYRIIEKRHDRTPGSSKHSFSAGDILYGKLRPYLKKCVVVNEGGYCSTEIVPFKGYCGISSEYLMYCMTSPLINYAINSLTYGMDMPRLGTKDAVQLLIPLPPLEEQKRIVAKIEELMPYTKQLVK